jgi:hypothetical protein
MRDDARHVVAAIFINRVCRRLRGGRSAIDPQRIDQLRALAVAGVIGFRQLDWPPSSGPAPDGGP